MAPSLIVAIMLARRGSEQRCDRFGRLLASQTPLANSKSPMRQSDPIPYIAARRLRQDSPRRRNLIGVVRVIAGITPEIYPAELDARVE